MPKVAKRKRSAHGEPDEVPFAEEMGMNAATLRAGRQPRANRAAVKLEDVLDPDIPRTNLPLLCLDPGETTGMCVISVPQNTIYAGAPYAGISVHGYREIKGEASAQADVVVSIADRIYRDTQIKVCIVGENFSLRKFSRDSSLLSPVEMTATFQRALREWDASGQSHQYFLQMPATAKRVVTDQRLERWGLYIRGSRHCRDALRHGITFFRRCADQPGMLRHAWGAEAPR